MSLNGPCEVASAGMSIGINLRGTRFDFKRGDVIFEEKDQKPVTSAAKITVQVVVMSSDSQLRVGYETVLYNGASRSRVRVLAIIAKLDNKGQVAIENPPSI